MWMSMLPGRLLMVGLLWLALFAPMAGAEEQSMVSRFPEHPRLILEPDRMPELRRLLAEDEPYQRLHGRVVGYAEAVLERPLVAFKTDGSHHQRLLTVSRQVMRRVLAFGVLIKLDPEGERAAAYRDRLFAEVDTAVAFDNWGPQHFLDVAEMSFAVAIAYDWFHDELGAERERRWREAMVEKGLRLGLGERFVDGHDRNWWITGGNNWNQVCHGGMTAAAIAVGDRHPELAEAILKQAKANIASGLAAYAPDGVYPEGPGYWGYGTMYTFLTLAMLDIALDTDWGILESPGFGESFIAWLHQVGPTGMLFNHQDCGLGWSVNPTRHHGYAFVTGDADLARRVEPLLRNVVEEPGVGIERDLPLSLLWYQPVDESKPVDAATALFGTGPVDVATMRSAWNDPDAWYFGIVAGRLANHGHLDAGSFILERRGVRWVHDLGRDRYTYTTDHDTMRRRHGGIHEVYRLNNRGHNTITIGGATHDPEGHATLDRLASVDHPDFTAAVVDLTGFVPEQATLVRRSGGLLMNQLVWLQDEIVDATAPVQWRMHTRAEVEVRGDHVVLTEEGQRMTLWVDSDRRYQLTAEPADPGNAFEADNEGFTRIMIDLPAGTSTLRVVFSERDPDEGSPVRWDAPRGGEAGFTWEGASERPVRVWFATTGEVLPRVLPDGRRLAARAMLTRDAAGDPRRRQVVGGALLGPDGAIERTDRRPPRLDDLLEQHSGFEPIQLDAHLQRVEAVVELANVYFGDEPLHFRIEPWDDAGEAWIVEPDAATVTLAPGERRAVRVTTRLRSSVDAGRHRYPLPKVRLSASRADGAETASVDLPLPTTSLRPRLVASRVDASPAGSVDAWRAVVDEGVRLGRMGTLGRDKPLDPVRRAEPATMARLCWDERALHVRVVARWLGEAGQPDASPRRGRDANVFLDDSVEVLIDPEGDQSRYFQVVVNWAGQVFDSQGFNREVDLEGLATTVTRQLPDELVEGHAWGATLSIPWASLGLDGPPEGARVLIGRNFVTGDGVIEPWQHPVSPKGNHQPGMFADLVLSP